MKIFNIFYFQFLNFILLNLYFLKNRGSETTPPETEEKPGTEGGEEGFIHKVIDPSAEADTGVTIMRYILIFIVIIIVIAIIFGIVKWLRGKKD